MFRIHAHFGLEFLVLIVIDMNITIVGCLIVGAALGLSTFLVLWSRRTIERIAKKGLNSAREIEKDLNDE